jgi:hypothetical protein
MLPRLKWNVEADASVACQMATARSLLALEVGRGFPRSFRPLIRELAAASFLPRLWGEGWGS